MIFSTIEFAIFMAVLFLVYWSIPQKYRFIVLLAANVYFYSCYDVEYLLVLFITLNHRLVFFIYYCNRCLFLCH